MKHVFGLTLIGFLFLSFFLSPVLRAAEEEEEKPRLPLAMEVLLKKPEQQVYELHIHLTNISEEPVEVDVRDLPWNPTDGPVWLSVFRLDDETSSIKQDVPFGKFGSRMVRLMPGESIQDKMVLNSRIPSLLKDIQHSGVQLQWECPPASLRFVCKAGAPNTITIPKGDPGEPDTYVVDQKACRTLEERIGLIDIPEGHEVLFLLTSETDMADVKKMETLLLQVDTYIQRCHPTWTNSWAVSFFTDKKYAGFLHEQESKRYFAQGVWQRANVGNYSSQIRTLFRFPWIKTRSDSVYISPYLLHQQNKI